MLLFMYCKKKNDISEKKKPRERENYVDFFDASYVENGCRNSNLMNSKIYFREIFHPFHLSHR